MIIIPFVRESASVSMFESSKSRLPLLQLELVSSGYDFSSASERPVESLLCYQYGKLGLNRYSGGLAETIVPYQNQEQ